MGLQIPGIDGNVSPQVFSFWQYFAESAVFQAQYLGLHVITVGLSDLPNAPCAQMLPSPCLQSPPPTSHISGNRLQVFVFVLIGYLERNLSSSLPTELILPLNSSTFCWNSDILRVPHSLFLSTSLFWVWDQLPTFSVLRRDNEEQAAFNYWLYHFLFMWSWVSHVTFLSLCTSLKNVVISTYLKRLLWGLSLCK